MAFRAVLASLDGAPTDVKNWPGPIGKAISKEVQDLPVVDYTRIVSDIQVCTKYIGISIKGTLHFANNFGSEGSLDPSE